MVHPWKEHAHHSHKSKAHSMGKINNLDIPVMRAVGEDRKHGVHESHASMQHKKQSAADGMKRGGHVKHHKGKPMAAMMAPPAIPPSADPAAMAAAGAGSSPAPALPPGGGAPMPGQPPMKRGGRTGIAKMPSPGTYPLTASSKSGIGRLEKAHAGKPPFKSIGKMPGPIKGHGE